MKVGRVGAVGMLGDMTPVVTGLIGVGGDDNSRSAWSSDGAWHDWSSDASTDTWRGAWNSDGAWHASSCDGAWHAWSSDGA